MGTADDSYREPCIGQAVHVAFGFEHRRSGLAFAGRSGVGPVSHYTDFRPHHADPGLCRGQPGRGGNPGSLGQGGLRPLLLGDLIKDRPQAAVQVGANLRIRRVRGERALQPSLSFLEESTGQPEPA